MKGSAGAGLLHTSPEGAGKQQDVPHALTGQEVLVSRDDAAFYFIFRTRSSRHHMTSLCSVCMARFYYYYPFCLCAASVSRPPILSPCPRPPSLCGEFVPPLMESIGPPIERPLFFQNALYREVVIYSIQTAAPLTPPVIPTTTKAAPQVCIRCTRNVSGLCEERNVREFLFFCYLILFGISP